MQLFKNNMPEQIKKDFKREIAHKLKVGEILSGTPIIEQVEGKERFRSLELGKKNVKRVNIIANVVDKYLSEGETKFASITVDDASGQINLKAFGEEIKPLEALNQGDTILVIGFLRSYNQELYIMPEIIKNVDPRYLLVRKLETEGSQPTLQQESQEQSNGEKSIKDKILEIIRGGEADGGADTEQIILKLNSEPGTISTEIKKLIEDGIVYEPRPGRVRYLG